MQRYKYYCVLPYPSCCYYDDPPDDFPPDDFPPGEDQHQGEHHRDHLLLHPDSVSSEAPQNLSNNDIIKNRAQTLYIYIYTYMCIKVLPKI